LEPAYEKGAHEGMFFSQFLKVVEIENHQGNDRLQYALKLIDGFIY
jgi:hypothetical protein